MPILDTQYKRKSAALTALVAVLILVLLFTFGLTYFDPPKEFGIAVNFGTSDFGSGNIQPTEALRPAASAPEESEPMEEEQEAEVVEQVKETAAAPEEAAEEVMTQENAEAIAIKEKEEARKKAEAKAIAEAERKAEEERKRQAAEKQRLEKERQEREAKRKNLDALMGGFSDGDGKADGGEGDDNRPGDKGKPTGDPNASGYYGLGGGGSGGNYRLGNRKAVSTPKPDYDCNEEGRVVVAITVDQTGRVVAAQPGSKGTTTSASCLWDKAREAALKTRFNADSQAPAKQLGEIIYNFSLSD